MTSPRPQTCGRLLAGAGLVTAAVPFFERTHALLPQDAALTLELADALRTSGRAPEARALAEAVLAAEPEHDGALLGVGLALLATGELDAARDVFERAAARSGPATRHRRPAWRPGRPCSRPADLAPR